MAFAFDDLVVDPVRRQLTRHGIFINVEPRVFDLLLYLIENRQRVVGKEDLVARVWGGRIVSDSALTKAVNVARKAIGDSGSAQRLIRTSARKGYRFVGDVSQSVPENVHARDSLPLPDKPSIAVLPFRNMAGEPEQEYFVDGLVEEIVTALSRFKSLFVIARNSSFSYKGRSPDVREVGLALGVHYVLEGSIRKSTDRIRISCQLIDANSGFHLWAERFDSALEDVFDLQDRVASRVVGVIVPKLDRAEMERAKRRPAESVHSYDCFLRGLGQVHEQTKASFEKALLLFNRAVEIDPDFSTAHGMIARCYAYLWGQGWSRNKGHDAQEIRRAAARVAITGGDDALALCAVGFALVRVCEEDGAGSALIDQGLDANPNLAFGWAHGGAVSIFLGKLDQGIERLERAIRLNPLDPETYWVELLMAYALLLKGKYDLAIEWAGKSLAHRPTYFAAVWATAVAHALAGRVREAQAIMPQIRRSHPDLRLANLRGYIPTRQPEYLELVAQGFRLAGLPE